MWLLDQTSTTNTQHRAEDGGGASKQRVGAYRHVNSAKRDRMATAPGSAAVLLEDTWEASDIIEECSRLQIACSELTAGAMLNYDSELFVQHTFMCDTAIVQKHLKLLGLENKVPDTYPKELESVLHRQIERRQLREIVEADLPLFIKPTSNDKAFDGIVVRDAGGLQRVREEVGETADELEVYAAEKVNFAVEYRLFVGNGTVYGVPGEHYVRDGDRSAGVPSDEFIQEIVKCCGDGFMAVDVGLMTKDEEQPLCNDNGVVKDYCPEATWATWAVVEVNPPFALDDCGLAIEPYVQFCIDSCAYIRGS